MKRNLTLVPSICFVNEIYFSFVRGRRDILPGMPTLKALIKKWLSCVKLWKKTGIIFES